MAQAPSLCLFELGLTHTDRNITETLSVRTARHPSETMQRVWLRVLAFAWHWQERLAFGVGLSDPDAADLVVHDLVGQTRLWVRVGKADPSKIQRVVNQQSQARVAVFFESPQRMETFIADAKKADCTRLGDVELIAADPALLQILASNEERRQKAQITIVGEHIYMERDGIAFDGPLTRGSA